MPISIFNIDFNSYLGFFLVMARVSGIFIAAPIFSSDNIPNTVKIGIALSVALMIFNLIPENFGYSAPADSIDFYLMVAKETLVGLAIGFIPRIILFAIDMAGNFISLQIGLSSSELIDPMTGQLSQIVSSFKNIIALVVFLSLDLHLFLIKSISASFVKIPLGVLFPSSVGVFDIMIRVFTSIFEIALRLSMPIIVVILLVNFVLAIMSRSMPQVNMFVIGIPLNIIVGILVLAFGMPITVNSLTEIFQTVGGEIQAFMDLIQP